MEYKIEKGISMPEKSENSIYPFHQMEVMDSFVFDYKKLSRISAACTTYQKKHAGVKFSCKKVNTTEGRCWRIR